MEEKMKKILFTEGSPIDFTTDSLRIMNFLNLESLWHYKKNRLYSKLISQKHNINFPDGRSVGLILRIKQRRGPSFTRDFLTSGIAKNKKHFFLGDVNIKDLSKISGISERQMLSYNPPYIKKLEFDSAEKKKIITVLKKFNPDYVWVCVGAPKQEILANQLFEMYPSVYFSVGAALEFFMQKKKEAPKAWRVMGMEWAYRGITDFKHSRKKFLRSLSALRYLRSIGLRR